MDDHEQRLRPAPQRVEHRRHRLGRRVTGDDRHQAELAQHVLQERHMHLERMLALIGGVEFAHHGQRAQPGDRLGVQRTVPPGIAQASAVSTARPRNAT